MPSTGFSTSRSTTRGTVRGARHRPGAGPSPRRTNGSSATAPGASRWRPVAPTRGWRSARPGACVVNRVGGISLMSESENGGPAIGPPVPNTPTEGGGRPRGRRRSAHRLVRPQRRARDPWHAPPASLGSAAPRPAPVAPRQPLASRAVEPARRPRRPWPWSAGGRAGATAATAAPTTTLPPNDREDRRAPCGESARARVGGEERTTWGPARAGAGRGRVPPSLPGPPPGQPRPQVQVGRPLPRVRPRPAGRDPDRRCSRVAR